MKKILKLFGNIIAAPFIITAMLLIITAVPLVVIASLVTGEKYLYWNDEEKQNQKGGLNIYG